MVWILADLSFMCHRAKWAIKDMPLEEFHTGMLFSFFEQLKTVCNDERIKSNRVVFFCDSRKSHRKKVFPGYKDRKREATPEEIEQSKIMREQEKLLRTHFLPQIGAQVVRQTGLEADDLMAMAVHGIVGDRRQAIIVTSDGDLLQCVSNAVHWFDPDRDRYRTPTEVIADKGIEPERYGMAKVIAGCSTDTVPGVPRVGEGTAIKYLKGELPSHHKTFQAIESPEGQAIITRNKGLILLPHEKTEPVQLSLPDWDADRFFQLCGEHGVGAYLQGKRFREWNAFFQGRQSAPRARKRQKRKKSVSDD
jgi:DNA polymerase-1